MASLQPALAVADAVLYEGYILYPYRRSSEKNRVRWQFGVVAPRPWIEARGETPSPGASGAVEAWYQQAECLLQAPPEATLQVRLRFLQVQDKAVQVLHAPSAAFEPVARLEVDGRVHLPFEEAVAHQLDVVAAVAELEHGVAREIGVAGGVDVEVVADSGGNMCGRVVRRRWPLSALVRVSAERVDGAPDLLRLRVRTENGASDVALAGATRPEILRHSLVAAHQLLAIDGGRFLSLLDPPDHAAAAARACANHHVFPVLAGEPGDDAVVLAAPIILYDHPTVAPESPGDLFDATEIDEILSLRTLTLTDEEKREARATDARAAALVDRVEAMSDQAMARLHGTIRPPGGG